MSSNNRPLSKYEKIALARQLVMKTRHKPGDFLEKQTLAASVMTTAIGDLRDVYKRNDLSRAVEHVRGVWLSYTEEQFIAQRAWDQCSNILLGIQAVITNSED